MLWFMRLLLRALTDFAKSVDAQLDYEAQVVRVLEAVAKRGGFADVDAMLAAEGRTHTITVLCSAVTRAANKLREVGEDLGECELQAKLYVAADALELALMPVKDHVEPPLRERRPGREFTFTGDELRAGFETIAGKVPSA